MNTNDKTLADAQPGGRVRLGDQAERARFEAWAHAQSYRGGNIMADRDAVHPDMYADPVAQLTWKSWQAALSAQPSPGGQDALAALQQDYDKLLDSFNRQVEVAEKIAGRALQQDDRIEELEEALAARQPVGQIPAGFLLVPEKFGIPADVWEGVEFVIGGPGTGEGEAYLDSTAWIGDLMQDDGSSIYGLHLSCDECPEEGSVTLAEFAAPPAQAVDLGQFIALAKFGEEFAFSAEKQPHSRVVYSQATRLLALIDSQAVGK